MKREEIIPQQTKSFIKENIKEINNKEFNNLFKDAIEQLNLTSYLAFVSIFNHIKPDVLSYMDYIPERFFNRRLDLINYKVEGNIILIKDGAFNGCNSLQTIILPKNLKEIETYAFFSCNHLYQVNYEGTKEEWKKIKIDIKGNKSLFRCGIDCIDGLIEYESTDTEWKIKE